DEDRRELLDPALELDVERVEQMLTAQRQAWELLTSELGSRAAQGRILEAHGDLRPEHVCLVDPPCVIDTLEFSLDLRTLDPVEELAYFHLECELLGAGWVGSTVVDVYRALSSDG